jgi:hypothetical protein
MNLQDLRKLAEAATAVWGKGHQRNTEEIMFERAANPATILALLDLIAQCKEALGIEVGLLHGAQLKARKESYAALAAIEQWEKK